MWVGLFAFLTQMRCGQVLGTVLGLHLEAEKWGENTCGNKKIGR